MSSRGELLAPTPESLNNMSKTQSRTWQIRAQRWLQIIPEEFKGMDVTKIGGKKKLKKWVLENIPQGGDKIFRGVLKPRKNQAQAQG
jgi:hypothetical protein